MLTADIHPARLHPRDARTRQDRVPLRPPLTVREHVQPVGAGTQRVRLLLRQMDEHVALTDLEGLAVLPGETGAAEDEKDLLLGALGVRGGRPLACIDDDALQAGRHGAGHPAEVVPVASEVPCLAAVRLDVVQCAT
jgi:hypothetical protein